MARSLETCKSIRLRGTKSVSVSCWSNYTLSPVTDCHCSVCHVLAPMFGTLCALSAFDPHLCVCVAASSRNANNKTGNPFPQQHLTLLCASRYFRVHSSGVGVKFHVCFWLKVTDDRLTTPTSYSEGPCSNNSQKNRLLWIEFLNIHGPG